MPPHFVLITPDTPGILNYARKMAGILARFAPGAVCVPSASLEALRLPFRPGHIPVYHLSNADRWMLVLLLLERNQFHIVLHDLLSRTAWIRPFLVRVYAAIFRKKNLRKILVHSQGARARLLKIWGPGLAGKITVVSFPLFSNQVDELPVDISPPPGALQFVMPGAITPQKGAHIVAEAFARSGVHETGAALLIAGRFSSQAYHQQVLQAAMGCPAIRIVDSSFSNAEFDSLFLSASVILTHKMYSKGESSGIVSNAIFFNRPVLVSDQDLSIELLQMPELSVPAGDVAALAARLQQICAEPALLERIRQHLGALRQRLQPANLAVEYQRIFEISVT